MLVLRGTVGWAVGMGDGMGHLRAHGAACVQDEEHLCQEVTASDAELLALGWESSRDKLPCPPLRAALVTLSLRLLSMTSGSSSCYIMLQSILTASSGDARAIQLLCPWQGHVPHQTLTVRADPA